MVVESSVPDGYGSITRTRENPLGDDAEGGNAPTESLPSDFTITGTTDAGTDGDNIFTPGAGDDAIRVDNEDIFGREFGDGSNRWIPGARETVANPQEAIANPYDTVAGAADAAALNFDEGVGGLLSLVDNQPGNTAGPQDTGVFEQETTPEVQSAVDETTAGVESALTDSLTSTPALLIGAFAVLIVATYGGASNAV